MINLTTARLIWLLYTSDCWGGSWSRAGPHGAGDLAGPSAGQEPATPLCPGTHPVPLSSLLCLLALMLSFPILRTLPLAPRVPSCQSHTRSSQAFTRASPPASPPRLPGSIQLSCSRPASLPPSLSAPPLCAFSCSQGIRRGSPHPSSSCTSFENLAGK